MLPYPWDAAQAGRRRKMDRVVLEGVTLGDLVYLGSAVLAGLIVSFVVRILIRAVKRSLRRNDPKCLRADLIDGFDGAVSLLIILLGLYAGLRLMPALGEYRTVITNGFVIIRHRQSRCTGAYARRTMPSDGRLAAWASARDRTGRSSR